MEIPIFDFDKFLNGTLEEKKNLSKEILDALKIYRCFYLKNYGINSNIVQQLFEFNKTFFEKPMEWKRKMEHQQEFYTGYDSKPEEELFSDIEGDLKESYRIKIGATHWPDDWDEFKQFMISFHEKCYLLSLEILKSFALALDIDSSLFTTQIGKDENGLLRLVHYPPLPAHGKTRIRNTEHTDYGAMTLLFQDSIGGLEVRTLDNKWIPAPYHPDTVVVNIGDCMEIWTNGIIGANPHQVVNPTDDRKLKSRYSIAFFCDPNFSSLIKCFDNFVSTEQPAKYRPILYRDYYMYKYDNYDVKDSS